MGLIHKWLVPWICTPRAVGSRPTFSTNKFNMSRTIRKDRRDRRYQEGRDWYQENGKTISFYTYKCKCSYCTNKKTTLDRVLIKDFKTQLREIE